MVFSIESTAHVLLQALVLRLQYITQARGWYTCKQKPTNDALVCLCSALVFDCKDPIVPLTLWVTNTCIQASTIAVHQGKISLQPLKYWSTCI